MLFCCVLCADPATKRWLLRHVDVVFGFPSVVRFSWSTARQLLHTKAYAVTWHDALDEEDAGEERAKIDANTRRLEDCMNAATNSNSDGDPRSGTGNSVASKERFHYFQQRHLDIVTTIA